MGEITMARLHSGMVQVMRWVEQYVNKDISDDTYWRNRLTQISRMAVVMVDDVDDRPAGHDVVKITLDTVPSQEIIVDGRLDNWWHLHDPEREGPGEDE